MDYRALFLLETFFLPVVGPDLKRQAYIFSSSSAVCLNT
jgi:hypothetical protein